MRTRTRRCALVLALLALLATGCSSVPSGFPSAPDETGGPAPTGNVGYQPPFLPIVFRLESNGSISVALAAPDLVSPLGTVSLSGGVVVGEDEERPLPPQPADAAQLIICANGSDRGCQAYRIATGRKMRIELDGRFVTEVERNRFMIRGTPGSTVRVVDVGPPSYSVVYGPARIDVETWEFDATSPDTAVDFERSRSGRTPDLQYDHLTGALTFINGAQVSRVTTYSRFGFGSPSDDIPSELECQQAGDWSPGLTPEQLIETEILACVKTAEGDLGYVYVEPQPDKNPIGYNVYSYTWVR